MRLKQILGGLTPAVKSALKALDDSGLFGLMYDCKIEDGFKPDGSRSRTFQRSGRYPLVLMYDPERKHPATGLFAEPEIEQPPEPKHTRPVPWVEVPPEPEPVKVEPVKIPVEAITPVKPEPEVVKKKKKK